MSDADTNFRTMLMRTLDKAEQAMIALDSRLRDVEKKQSFHEGRAGAYAAIGALVATFLGSFITAWLKNHL
jgi:energy-coupling factor transporter transmembrane protein EcfT